MSVVSKGLFLTVLLECCSCTTPIENTHASIPVYGSIDIPPQLLDHRERGYVFNGYINSSVIRLSNDTYHNIGNDRIECVGLIDDNETELEISFPFKCSYDQHGTIYITREKNSNFSGSGAFILTNGTHGYFWFGKALGYDSSVGK